MSDAFSKSEIYAPARDEILLGILAVNSGAISSGFNFFVYYGKVYMASEYKTDDFAPVCAIDEIP